MVWECHACNALLIADYRSDVDKDLCEILIPEEAERYQLVSSKIWRSISFPMIFGINTMVIPKTKE